MKTLGHQTPCESFESLLRWSTNWSTGHISPFTCFHMALELRMVIAFLILEKKKQKKKNAILWRVNIKCKFSIHRGRVVSIQSHSVWMACPQVFWVDWAGAMETALPGPQNCNICYLPVMLWNTYPSFLLYPVQNLEGVDEEEYSKGLWRLIFIFLHCFFFFFF